MTARKIEIDLVRSIPLFARVADEHLASLAAAASLRRTDARALIFAEGGRPGTLYTIIAGAAELFSEHDERRLTIAVVRPVRPLALFSLLADRSPVSARALEPAELLAIPARLVIELAGRDVGLAEAMVREFTHQALDVVEDLKTHRLLTTTERVADWILRQDGSSGGTGTIVIPFDKRILASYLGMAPEQLSRHFATLAAIGVSVDGRSITFTDREALSAVAGVANSIAGRAIEDR